MAKKRVAVIGAGPSGLAQLRAFQSAKLNGEDIPDVVCYEKQDDWGGLWKYTWRTGVEESGEPCHGSMYRYLWSNGPKEGLEFADYTFEEHFGKPIASYPPRAVLFDYIEGRVNKAGVRDWIRFNNSVRDIRYDEGTGMFSVTARDAIADSETTEEFDHVVVCTGHFSSPNVPYYPGFESYNGSNLTDNDNREAHELEGKEIMNNAPSYSAEDIGSQCWKYGCRSVTVAHRTAPMGYAWPDNWQEVPALVKVEGRTAHFKDGTSKKVDAIILCTGYKHHFPFLPDDLRLKTANRLAAADLYKGVVWNKNPKMFYIGMQDQWYTFNMFDAQAWWVRDQIMGKIALPDQAAMEADPVAREAAEDAIEDDYGCIRYQGDYVRELIAETDYPSFDVDAANQAFFEWKKHKKKGIMEFRNHGYTSPMTGTKAPPHHTAWKDALDDSLESYLEV